MDSLDFSSKATVLVVDDTPDNLALVSALLRPHYTVRIANSGERALQMARATPPDIMLLDIMMPGLSGYDVIRQLKADPRTRQVPVIFLTAMTADEDERKGFDLGAADYITKPISPTTMLARLRTQLENKAAADFLRDQNQYLEAEVQRRTRETREIQDVTIQAMASLAETRDSDTGNHIRRTQNYVRALAEHLRDHPVLGPTLSPSFIEALYKSAPLHDIGKVGIPDRILLKPGKFTPEEFEIMKTHTTLGRDAIEAAERQLGLKVDFLRHAKEIAYYHQEKWDGSGYPEGISGTAIPLSARLMAVADVYDALISRRVYKEGMPHEKAATIIREGRGSHFDPDIVDAFSALEAVFQQIALQYADSDADLQAKAAQMERLQAGGAA